MKNTSAKKSEMPPQSESTNKDSTLVNQTTSNEVNKPLSLKHILSSGIDDIFVRKQQKIAEYKNVNSDKVSGNFRSLNFSNYNKKLSVYCPVIKGFFTNRNQQKSQFITKKNVDAYNASDNHKFDLTLLEENQERNPDHIIQECLKKAKGKNFTDRNIGVCILLAIKHNGVSNKSSRAGFVGDLEKIYGDDVNPKPFFKFSAQFQKAAARKDTLTGNPEAKRIVGLRLKRLSPDYGLEYLKGMDIKNGKMGEVFNEDFFKDILSNNPSNDVESVSAKLMNTTSNSAQK